MADKIKGATKHDHPACKTESAHRHETVVTGGSAGGQITEGCVEHYNERIVAEDIVRELNGQNAVEWRKAVVISEILTPPRCRKRR